MNDVLQDWCDAWAVPANARLDLMHRLARAAIGVPATPLPGASEAAVQQQVRLEAAQAGVILWRNNVGALQDEAGRWVRYGLANDSAQLNAHVKSADLVGIRPVLVTPAHVGRTIGQFVSRECKAGGWRWSGTPRELAQQRWAELVTAAGGDARVATGRGTL